MKLKNSHQIFARFGAAAFIVVLSVFVINTQAQTTNRRATGSTKRTATPTPTPVSPEVPVIVSRADDFPDNSQIIVQPVELPPNQNQGNETVDYESRIKELNTRINTLESTRENQYDQKQQRLLLNLDILSRAEQRADALRKQLYDLIERENQIQGKLDQISNDLRPEVIDRTIAFAGTLRPEELRERRRKTLQLEQTNLENLLTEISNNKTNLQTNVQKADALVDKLRFKLEKDIDDALAEDDNPPL